MRMLETDSSLPFVSVIVPVFDDAESLAIFLEALAAQDYPRERFECVVVDNDSHEPIRIPAACSCAVRVFREQQAGSYAARKSGNSGSCAAT